MRCLTGSPVTTLTSASIRWISLRRTAGIVFLLGGLCACSPERGPAPQRLSTAEIRINDKALTVEVARAPEERRTGMMHRFEIGPDEGMLFVFAEPQVLSFYMKNTHVPLSVAFIQADGTIDRIRGMTPHRLDPVTSRRPCLYALEMPQGWFADHDIWEGQRVAVPESITAAE